METDRLNGVIAALICKLGSREVIVVRLCFGHFMAREKVVVFIELEAGRVLELV